MLTTATPPIQLDTFVLEALEAALTARGLRLRHCTTGEIEPVSKIGNGTFARDLADLSVLYAIERIDASA